MAQKSFEEMDVLLVEPSVMQAELVTRMLTGFGMPPPRHAGRAQDAWLAMREKTPDTVISSLYLPDGDGAQLVTQMRAEAALADVPFILVSSETRPQALEPIRQAGACCILEKPFSAEPLERAFETVGEFYEPFDDLPQEDLEELHVLLVDDSHTSRRHIRKLLEGMGIADIREAENGKEAVAVLSESMVDLVNTDYNMPEMDGKALTEYIRTRSWQSEVPILMITSEQNASRLAAVEKAGVSAICDKPFEAEGIRRVLVQALKR
jgi:two-component system chemotaxis response regulator CheY